MGYRFFCSFFSLFIAWVPLPLPSNLVWLGFQFWLFTVIFFLFKLQPYLHKSRHLHAVRRARGCGGRFLKTRNLNNEKGETVDKNMCNGKFSQPTESHSSETPKSDSGNWKPSMVANGSRSNHSGSEVTSMFLRGNLSYFQTSHSHPSVHPLFDMKTTRHGIVIPSKWVAAANNRCDLKVWYKGYKRDLVLSSNSKSHPSCN